MTGGFESVLTSVQLKKAREHTTGAGDTSRRPRYGEAWLELASALAPPVER